MSKKNSSGPSVLDLEAALESLGENISSADAVMLMSFACKCGLSIKRLRSAAAIILFTLEQGEPE